MAGLHALPVIGITAVNARAICFSTGIDAVLVVLTCLLAGYILSGTFISARGILSLASLRTGIADLR